MVATNIVKNGKWYLLLFEEYARFLVEKTNYDVYMISYDKPMIRVNKENFDKLNENVKKFKEKAVQGDCFVMELELPPMKVEINYNVYGYTNQVEFNSPGQTGLNHYALYNQQDWVNKEVDRIWSENHKNNIKTDLPALRDELFEKINNYNNGDI
jgi:hypothetical protein